MTVSGDATSANSLGRPEQTRTPEIEHPFATGVSVLLPSRNVPGTENPTILLISSTKNEVKFLQDTFTNNHWK